MSIPFENETLWGGGGSKTQVDTLPVASVDELGKVYQYVGVTSGDLIHDFFYECQEVTTGNYAWVNVSVQLGDPSIQVDALPTASSDLVGTIYQYIGTTDSTFTNGFFYKCTEDTSTTPSTYSWESCEVQDATESMELTQAQYDALTPAEKNNGTVYYVNETEPVYNMDNSAVGNTPIGTIISVMGTSAPKNFLICNGQILNIDTYPQLAHYFKTQFGSENYFGGDGTTTFAVPDLRGEFLRGAGPNSHTNQGSGGEKAGDHQDASEVPYITRNTGNARLFYANVSSVPANIDSVVGIADQYSLSGTKGSGTFNAYMMTRPTNTSVLYCIAYKNIYVDVKQDYSYEEKEIGYWVDGKPIYQKTVSFTGITDGKTIAFNISNVADVIDINAIIHLSDKSVWDKAPESAGSNAYVRPQFLKSSNSVVLSVTNYSSWAQGGGFITLQYTKTTD